MCGIKGIVKILKPLGVISLLTSVKPDGNKGEESESLYCYENNI